VAAASSRTAVLPAAVGAFTVKAGGPDVTECVLATECPRSDLIGFQYDVQPVGEGVSRA
jgi:hypothetical protein